MCMSTDSFSPQLHGLNQTFSLSIGSCQEATQLYYERTGRVFPYQEYNIAGNKCEDPLELTNTSSTIKLINKAMNATTFETDMYEVDLVRTYSLIENMTTELTVVLEREQVNIGANRFYNSDEIDAVSRQVKSIYRVKSTAFSLYPGNVTNTVQFTLHPY